ncbi:glycosyltransferase [Lachnospiraceae bacterium MD308]|nr:glycosyltransferase [Lachnospiraceae bacterium MD308]
MAKEISISQCMIVKNEEKNIRRALSWAKEIVQEQVVVDTGSTDRTVEIAESMGAKIFYFEWCDDFSAAKNYAIEQATGDWIAFLDADEYFTPEDARKLPEVIRTAEKNFSQNGTPDVIRATWAQLNDEGKVFAVSEQDRIFRNKKDVRYRKPIHEVLASTALQTAEKVLEKGLHKAEPPQINTALMTWFTAASSGRTGSPEQYKEKAYALYERYCKAGYSYPDIEFGMACYLQKLGDTDGVVLFFEAALQKLEYYKGVDTLKMAGRLDHIYAYLALYYSEKKDAQKSVYYCTLSLRVDKYQETPLSCLLELLKDDRNTEAAQAYAFLGKIYDIDSLKDKLFILKLAIKTGYKELEEFIRAGMSEEEIKELWSDNCQSWAKKREALKEAYPNISIRNRTDMNFLSLLNELRDMDAEKLYEKALIRGLADMLKEHHKSIEAFYEKLADYRSKQCLYGLLEMWLRKESRIISMARENGLEFWDMDVIPTAEGMTCADIGEHQAECANGFLYTYDDTYKKIYFFTQEGAEGEELEKSFSGCRDVSFINTELADLELDKAVEEPLDLIRMDVSAGLLELLAGCRGHIEKKQPKLAVCIDSDCNHLWQVPKLLKEWNPNYRFYLRYYGEKPIPDRIVLFAV